MYQTLPVIRSLLFLFWVLPAIGLGQWVEGTVRSDDGDPLPFAGVYLKNSTVGTTANNRGAYTLRLEPGTHTLVFTYLGFGTVEEQVKVDRSNRIRLDVTLSRQTTEIGTAEVVADTRDKAREIMQKVRERRRDFVDSLTTYTCETYNRRSLVREHKDWQALQATGLSTGVMDSAGIDIDPPEYLLLHELVSRTAFRSSENYQENIEAIQEYKEGDIPKEPLRSFQASATFDYGEPNIVPWARISKNAYLVYEDVLSCSFDFYQNTFEFAGVLDRPLTSPIASGGALLYRYDYDGVVFENGKKVYRIQVEPLLAGDALFEGLIFIDAESYALVAVDLRISPAAMSLCNGFHIVQRYIEHQPGIWVPELREINYHFREGKFNVLGFSVQEHSNYKVNLPLAETFSVTEARRFAPEAFDRDTTYWSSQRPDVLRKEDLDFMQKSDSVYDYLESDEWKDRQDSVYNLVDIWTPFIGWGYRNHRKGIQLYVEGLISQVNPFGIGGYRHRLPFQIDYEFDNHYLLETEFMVDYGFRNQDVKGRADVGLTYVPLKFVRTRVVAGYYYSMVNNFASVAQVFSRSNYVQTTDFQVAQRMEIVNGLFGELTVAYQDQRALVGLELADWSNDLFGDLNTPLDFARYRKTEIGLRLQYTIRQRYMIRDGKKLILESKYPKLVLDYKKGIPGLFGSEVNYDYVEVGASDDFELLRYGTSSWRVQLGTYLNKKNLRVLEYKYFRGSDDFFFSTPLASMQLLGPTLNTPNEWFQANYIHHFEGAILGKVPLLNRMKLKLAAGGSLLSIPDSDFHHGEVFGGLERNFRIKSQLFRLGAYAVTADNTIDGSNLTFKFGIAFYDSFRRKWDY